MHYPVNFVVQSSEYCKKKYCNALEIPPELVLYHFNIKILLGWIQTRSRLASKIKRNGCKGEHLDTTATYYVHTYIGFNAICKLCAHTQCFM